MVLEPAWKSAKKHHDQMHELYRKQMFTEAAAQCKLIRRNFDGRYKAIMICGLNAVSICNTKAYRKIGMEYSSQQQSDKEKPIIIRYTGKRLKPTQRPYNPILILNGKPNPEYKQKLLRH